jgi:hypothetical protein
MTAIQQDEADASTAMAVEGIEHERLAFERWRAEQEYQLKRSQFDAELDLKRHELDINRRNSERWVFSSPLLIAIIGLFATVLANLIQNTVQGIGNQRLERQRFEATVIQKALDTNDVDEAAKRLRFLLNLGLIHDDTGKIAAYVASPETIPVQPSTSDTFLGRERRQAKLSVASGPVERFSDLGSLLQTLANDDDMTAAAKTALKDPSGARLAKEQRNVRVVAYLHAAKHEVSNDYRLVICDHVDARVCMVAVVSGLPGEADGSFPVLEQARKAFATLLASGEPGATYLLYAPPMQIEIGGSLLFNAVHPLGTVGPGSLREKITTRWEIHPVTEIAGPR